MGLHEMKAGSRWLSRTAILFFIGILFLIPAQEVLASGGRQDLTEVDYSAMEGWPEAPELDAEGAFLIELNTGAVLYSKNGDEQFYPASITKILTALVTIENCSLDEMVTFSYEATHDLEDQAFSYIAAKGDSLSVEDCLYALLLQSSNEAAYALAEHVAGSVSAFADKMNAKAQELGAVNSHFVNPHGLFDENHYTTPHDMARILWAAVQNETFMTIESAVSYTTASTTTQKTGFLCRVRHQMMQAGNTYYNKDVKAGKTGYVQKAKSTLATYAARDDRELICVVMKGNTDGQIYKDTQALLDYGFKDFSYQSISSAADYGMMEQRAAQVTDRVVQNFEINHDTKVLLPNTAGDLTFQTEFTVDADSLQGDQMTGLLTYAYLGYVFGSDAVTIKLVPLQVATEAPSTTAALVVKNSYGQELELTDIAWMVAYVAAGIMAIILILHMLRLISRQRRKKRRRRTQAEKKRASEEKKRASEKQSG